MQLPDLLLFQSDLLNELLQSSGLKGLVRRISKTIDIPVLISNSSYRVIASSFFEDVQYESNYIKISKTSPNAFGTIATLNHEENCFSFPIVYSNNILGFLIFITKEAVEQQITVLAEIAVQICAVEFNNQKQLYNLERQYKDAFIFELIDGNIKSNDDIVSRGNLWGYNLDLPHCVVVFALEDYENTPNDNQIAFGISDMIENELLKAGQTPLVLRKKGEVTAVLPVNNNRAQERKAYVDIFVKKILAGVKSILKSRVLRVGSGRTCLLPNEICQSYQEAKVALELGTIMNIRSRTPFFRDLGIARILYNHDQKELLEFYKDNLGELIRYDKEQNSKLINTLELFLSNCCDLKLAAYALFLHPNTLRYRLKKIEEILGINLSNFDTRVDLLIAFKIRHLNMV